MTLCIPWGDGSAFKASLKCYPFLKGYNMLFILLTSGVSCLYHAKAILLHQMFGTLLHGGEIDSNNNTTCSQTTVFNPTAASL